MDSIGENLKKYEKEYERVISPDNHIIIRIDGHHFSKYTKGLPKPHIGITNAMIKTTLDLVDRFNATTGYTQSDEITLFIKKLEPEKWNTLKHIFGGRVQKLVSLSSSFATMMFNRHTESIGLPIGNQGMAYFDSRVYGIGKDDDVFNSFMWRVRDCERNSRSTFAQVRIPHKELHGKSSLEQVQLALSRTGDNWFIQGDAFKYGTFVKRETYSKESSDHIVHRTRLCTFSKKIVKYDQDHVSLLLNNYKK